MVVLDEPGHKRGNVGPRDLDADAAVRLKLGIVKGRVRLEVLERRCARVASQRPARSGMHGAARTCAPDAHPSPTFELDGGLDLVLGNGIAQDVLMPAEVRHDAHGGLVEQLATRLGRAVLHARLWTANGDDTNEEHGVGVGM